MAALLLAVFTASAGFGVLLPLLPELIEGVLGAGATAAAVSRHTGLLTAAYAFALFLFAPAWGRLSDRYGRRTVLMAGLSGLAASMAALSLAEGLAALYAQRFLGGMFASALLPAASARISESSTIGQERGRRLAYVSMASVAGFLLGPMLGGFTPRFAGGVLAAVALLVALSVAAVVRDEIRCPARAAMPAAAGSDGVLTKLIFLAFVVSTGIGVFDIGLTLRADELALTTKGVALMFAACGLVMLAAQSLVFSRWIRAHTTRWFIAPALLLLATGLLLMPWASNVPVMLALIGAVAASAGILPPIVSFWISTQPGEEGRNFGSQGMAMNLGVTLGAAAGGLLSDLQALPDVAFILAAALAAGALLMSVRLPKLLIAHAAQQ